MSTAWEIQCQYYPLIENIGKKPEELAIQTLHLAQVLIEYLEGYPEHRPRVLQALRFNMLETFIQIPPKALGPMEVIKMIEDVFGENGPFSGQDVKFQIVRPAASSWIAALHYLQSAGEPCVAQIGKSCLPDVIARVALGGGRNWTSLQAALSEVDAGCGTHFLASVPDMLENVHNHFKGTDGAQMIQVRGGLEKLKAVGADLNKVSLAVMSDLELTELNEKGFPLMYSLIKDMTLDLMASGTITKQEGSERFSRLFNGALHALTRARNHKHDCWIDILKESSKHAGSSVDQVGLANMVVYLCEKGASLPGLDWKAHAVPGDFNKALKKTLKSVVHEHDRFNFVKENGLKELFNTTEILLMKGDQLKGDLGM